LELPDELGIQYRVGHPAKLRAAEPRKQKHDRRDARLILELLTAKRFPDIWMPSSEQRDLRTLLRDRHQWVKMRARLQHTLQSMALHHALRKGTSLWTAAGQDALRRLPLPPYTRQRRNQLLSLYAELQKRIQELDRQVEEQARQRPQARRLLTHPGVGPVTALATEVFLGDPSRFPNAKQVASYIGMIPREYSSGQRQRLEAMTKQGNSLLRYLWTEAGDAYRTKRPGAEAILSPQAHPERNGQGEDRSGAQTWNPALDSVARPDRLRRILPSWKAAAEWGSPCGNA
jgi:transposase